MVKIDPKYRQLTFVLVMSILLTFLMSGVMTYVLRGGFVPYYVSFWLSSWGVAFVTVLPINFFLPSIVRRFASRFGKARTFIYVLTISTLMSLILSFVLTMYTMKGIRLDFASHWIHAWLIALVIVFGLNFFIPKLVNLMIGKLFASKTDSHQHTTLETASINQRDR